MATYSAAPGITTSGKLVSPAQGETGSSSETYTVPANSYAEISIYHTNHYALDSTAGAANQSVQPGDGVTISAANFALGKSIVASGEDIVVTRTVHIGLGQNSIRVSVGGRTIFNDPDGFSNNVHVHYVVFS